MANINVSNIVVLMDPYTRNIAESITYDAIVRHASVITDAREISEAYYGSSFVFFEPAVPSIVTLELLSTLVELYGIHPYLVYRNPDVGNMFAGVATCINADYRNLDWNLVYAVVNGDSAILGPYQRIRSEPLEFAKIFERLPAELVKPINQMYASYLGLAHDVVNLVSENAKLNETVENYKSVGKRTATAIEELKKLNERTADENRTYCAMLSENYDVTFNGMYPDRPKVLYIKTVSHLSGIDNLLMVLYGVLVKQYKVSCKVIKLVDSSNASSVRYIPNVYTPLHSTYTTDIVLTNDFIVSLGAYNMLMSLLMLNRSELNFLIVHDMRGTLGSALDSSLIDLKIHEMSSDYAILGEYDNIISDAAGKSQFVWNFKEVADFAGSDTIKLSGHPTVSKILDHLL